MIDLKQVDLFQNCFTTLHETSRDDAHDAYMTDSEMLVVNFDKAKTRYCDSLHLSSDIKSCDSFFSDGHGSCILVEFKNGSLQCKKEIFSLKKKIYDSLLILSDSLEVRPKEMRESFKFILVYSEEKNPIQDEADCPNDTPQTTVQDSASFSCLQNLLTDHAKQEMIRFDLGGFKKYCFQEVHTYTKEEFERFLQTKIGSSQMEAAR